MIRDTMRFISTSDLAGPEWRFLGDVCADSDLQWGTVSGLPHNGLERVIRRPSLARWRAAAEAARQARRSRDRTILVSHLPLMGSATNVMRRMIAPGVPQVAFSFNFTELPTRGRRAFLRKTFEGISEFVVYSRFERGLYAAEFGLPEDRIRYLPWAMERPEPAPANPLPAAIREHGYIAAIGGEGRDYALLADAMRARPALRCVVVARPYSISGLQFPENVVVFTNLPIAQTWRIAADSRAIAIPLKTDTTACGHVTLVGTQLLGLPLIITMSCGVADYVVVEQTALMVPAGDNEALVAAFDRLETDADGVAAIASRAQTEARVRSRIDGWVDYFRALVHRSDLG